MEGMRLVFFLSFSIVLVKLTDGAGSSQESSQISKLPDRLSEVGTTIPTTNVNRKKKNYRKSPAPFGKFLHNSEQRQELLNLIKTARREGASKIVLDSRIDRFLELHLDATELKEVRRLKEEGRKINPPEIAPRPS